MLKPSPGRHRLKSQLCPLYRNDEYLVLISLTAESPLENLLLQRRDGCCTAQPVLCVEQYLHDICFPAWGVSPSASYNFVSKAGSVSDFLTGKVPPRLYTISDVLPYRRARSYLYIRVSITFSH